MLHGESGEDGAVREVLELLAIPYVGSGPAACRTAFDKPVAKSVVERVGITTPRGVCLPHETFRELGAAAGDGRPGGSARAAAVVKPARSGSALGCTLVATADELPDAMVNAFAYGAVALIEHLVEGTEVAVPVVDDGSGPRALPAVAIRARRRDLRLHRALHRGLDRVHGARPSCPTSVLAECARVAVAAHEALGLRDLSRSDLIVDDDGTVWFLEVNVAPGFTETSTRAAVGRGRRPRPGRGARLAGPGGLARATPGQLR